MNKTTQEVIMVVGDGKYDAVAKLLYKMNANLEIDHLIVDRDTQTGKVFKTHLCIRNAGTDFRGTADMKDFDEAKLVSIAVSDLALNTITLLGQDFHERVVRQGADSEEVDPATSKISDEMEMAFILAGVLKRIVVHAGLDADEVMAMDLPDIENLISQEVLKGRIAIKELEVLQATGQK